MLGPPIAFDASITHGVEFMSQFTTVENNVFSKE